MSSISEPTDWPIPGKQYTVQKSVPTDSLSRIASKAYGDGTQWRQIWKANKANARLWKQTNPETGETEWVRNPNRSFWPGDIIAIPGDSPLDEIEIALIDEEIFADDPKEFALFINNERINVVSLKATISMDTATDGWTAVASFDPFDDIQRETFRPYAYHPAELYIGGKLAIRGTCYTVTPSIDETNGNRVTLAGWSLTADIVDSGVRSPREFNGKKLEDLARGLVEPLGIPVIFDEEIEDKPFARASATESDTIFSFLSELAKQRSIQLSSTSQGKLLFTKAKIDSSPVASLQEGVPPVRSVTATFDGRQRFNSYTAQAQSPGRKKGKQKTATSLDENIPKSRFKFFSANDTDPGDLQKAADWERGKQFVEAFTIPLSVTNIYSDETLTQTWQPNTMVTLISSTLMIDFGFDFLIRSVEYSYETDGITAVLLLVPPQAFTGEAPPEIWTANNG